MVLPTEAQGGWDFWEKNVSSLEAYTKEVQFFKIFNIAWIFSWEYGLQNYLKKSFPLSLVCVNKVKWWNEFKTKLCRSENVEHYYRPRTKKFTLHNLHMFEAKAGIGPPTPQKIKSPSTSTKARAKGLSQEEKDILVFLKDDPHMRQIFLQKIIAKMDDSDDDEVSPTSPNAKPKNDIYQDS